jgi:fatty-acyl-CoA synthase
MGEVGVAFIIPKQGDLPTAEEIKDYCSRHLARFKVPKYVLFISQGELPTTATGRPRKFLLTERAIKDLGLE